MFFIFIGSVVGLMLLARSVGMNPELAGEVN
jgi:hypothetical protein